MNSTPLLLITLCKPCNNRAQKQQILLGPGRKSLPEQLAQTTTGASAAQHPLQHNQISCAQRHQLDLHHAVFEPALHLHSHSDPSPLPTNAIQFGVVPNACAAAIRQQPADKQLECSLPNLQLADLRCKYCCILTPLQAFTDSR